MPIISPRPGKPAARLVFDQDSYTLDQPIRFRVVVDRLPTCPLTFTGHVRVGDDTLEVSGCTSVADDERVVYGPLHAPGWQVIQDPDDPARYTAIRA